MSTSLALHIHNSMNSHTIINMNTIKTVSVVFQNDLLKEKPRHYTYLVPPGLTPKSTDLAVVFVRGKYECVSIVGINPPLDPDAKFEYKPLVDIVEPHPMPDILIKRCDPDDAFDHEDDPGMGPYFEQG